MDKDTVTISKHEYESLKKDAEFLADLQSAGVDNWHGYEYAQQDYRSRHNNGPEEDYDY